MGHDALEETVLQIRIVESLNYACYRHGSPQKHSFQFLLSEAGEITEASNGNIEVIEFTYLPPNIFFRRQ